MKVAITSARNEAPYLIEWVAWLKLVGFDHIVIFTNNNTDDTIAVLSALKATKSIDFYELEPPPGKKPQMHAFENGVQWCHEHKPAWVMCIDPDEYPIFHRDKHLSDYIGRFSYADAIAINWRIFGSSNQANKGCGTTIERFTMAAHPDDAKQNQFKTLFRYSEDITRFHHRVFWKSDSRANRRYVFSDGLLLSPNQRLPGFKQLACLPVKLSQAQVNHYMTRSFDELLLKMGRGDGFKTGINPNPAQKAYFDRYDLNECKDTSALDMFNNYFATYRELRSNCLSLISRQFGIECMARVLNSM